VAGDFKDIFGEDWRPKEFGEGEPPQPEGEPFFAPPRNESASLFPEEASGDYTSETENRTPRSLNEKEVKVTGVFQHMEPGVAPQHFVLLKDNRGRKVPIWVGQFEAWSISYALDDANYDRPLTHDLMKLLLDKLGAGVDRIIIDDLWQETFYAKITLIRPGGEYVDIDARPSDAIALALRERAPIYMAESVLESTIHQE
jgi:bifunctional DNase/RNase